MSAGTTSLPMGCGSNWAQGSWSGTLGTGNCERSIHKLFPKAIFRQCSISSWEAQRDYGDSPLPKGTLPKPLLQSYHCWMSRVVLALLPSDYEPLLGPVWVSQAPLPHSGKAGCDFQPTACAQDTVPQQQQSRTHTGHGGASWQLSKERCAGPWPEGCSGGGAEEGGTEHSRLLLSHCPLSQARGTKCREPQESRDGVE